VTIQICNDIFLVQRYASGKIFVKVRSYFLCEIDNRQKTKTGFIT